MGSSTFDIFLHYFSSSIFFCDKGFNLDTCPKYIVLLCIQIGFYGLYLTVWLGTSTSQSTWHRAKSSASSLLGCYQAPSLWPSVGVARLTTLTARAFNKFQAISLQLEDFKLMNWQVTSWPGWGGGGFSTRSATPASESWSNVYMYCKYCMPAWISHELWWHNGQSSSLVCTMCLVWIL